MNRFDRARRGALVIGWLTCAVSVAQVKNDLPDDFEQILPRGRIAAITDPSFIPASSADIRDDAWVLGVVIDGQARAFSLNLLNHHEVVNDEIGQTPYAAVW
jgi:carotenoid cleavage dioxygenase-like enzyme